MTPILDEKDYDSMLDYAWKWYMMTYRDSRKMGSLSDSDSHQVAQWIASKALELKSIHIAYSKMLDVSAPKEEEKKKEGGPGGFVQ